MDQGSCFLECSCHHSEHLILCPQVHAEHLLHAKHCPSPSLSWDPVRMAERTKKQTTGTQSGMCSGACTEEGVGTEVTEEGHV